MIALLLISFVCCIGYAAYMKLKYDVSSISESYYKADNKLYFWLWSILTALSLLPCWLEVSGDNYQFVAFLSACSLIAVGCFPDYKKEHSWQHPLLTCFSGILAIIWASLAGVIFVPLILLLCTAGLLIYSQDSYILYLKELNHSTFYIINRIGLLYWVEVAAFTSIYICILIKLIK